MYLSHFILNDIAYIVGSSMIYKYNFSLNTWSSESHSISGTGLSDKTNQAFTYNEKAYIVVSAEAPQGDKLLEYNPTTGVWTRVLNLPFSSEGQSIIISPNGVYFGFGFKDGKIRNTNDWQELRFNAGVSDNIGIYESISNNSCSTGLLELNATSSIYDEQGDLFLTLKSGSYISNLCIEINSINLSQNFRTGTANLGNGFLEKGMYLNKSVLFKNGGINSSDILRLYYTTTELNKLVQDFNTLYNSNKTLQDIKLVTYYSGNDRDPLNNVTTGVLYKPTLQAYGTDKYFEISPSIGSVIGGEIYAVILSGEILGNESFQTTKISIYPNPTSTLLSIQVSDHQIIDKIIITDLTGKQVLQQNQNTNQVDAQNLVKGIYFIQAFSGERMFTSKFIKE
jgi:hypothetical protein